MAKKESTPKAADRARSASNDRSVDRITDDSRNPVPVSGENEEREKRISNNPRQKLLKEVKEQEAASELGSE